MSLPRAGRRREDTGSRAGFDTQKSKKVPKLIPAAASSGYIPCWGARVGQTFFHARTPAKLPLLSERWSVSRAAQSPGPYLPRHTAIAGPDRCPVTFRTFYLPLSLLAPREERSAHSPNTRAECARCSSHAPCTAEKVACIMTIQGGGRVSRSEND
ncbi:hypothetical protein MRX96_035619 [Rhipicephalus microplus]